jgi:hypothetical protein
MTRVVFIGEMFYSDLSVGGGPVVPGAPGGPVDPGYGRPGWSPVDPGYGRPGGPHVGGGPIYPGHPANRPPGSWGGPTDPGWGHTPGHPGNWVPGSGYPSGQPLPPGVEGPGTEVPPEDYTPAPPPEHISSQYIVSVYDPTTMTWTTKSYPPPPA